MILVKIGLSAGEVKAVGEGVKVREVEGLREVERLDFAGDDFVGDELSEEGEGNAEEGSEYLADVGAVVFLLDFEAFVEEGSERVPDFKGSIGLVRLTIIICVRKCIDFNLTYRHCRLLAKIYPLNFSDESTPTKTIYQSANNHANSSHHKFSLY